MVEPGCEDDHIIKKSKNNKMPLNLARFLSDPRLYHLLLYCIITTRARKQSFNFSCLALNSLDQPPLMQQVALKV